MTRGYCVQCGEYAYGRYRWPINDRAEAIDRHEGCLLAPEQAPRRDAEGAGHAAELVDVGGHDAVLQPADGLAVDPGEFSEALLGEEALVPEGEYTCAEGETFIAEPLG